jgi:DNA-binding response OmpR family regulator
MRILLVEDDETLLEFLKIRLRFEGFSVDTEKDGNKGSFLARTNSYDVIILDYVLPKKSGAKICQEIRARGTTVPVIIISVQTEVPTRVELLNMGADDFVIKPFPFEELLARIRAVLRRPVQIKEEVLSIDDLVLDTVRFNVERGGRKIKLTRKEFALLEYMLRNKGAVLSRGNLMEHVWDIAMGHRGRLVFEHHRNPHTQPSQKTSPPRRIQAHPYHLRPWLQNRLGLNDS